MTITSTNSCTEWQERRNPVQSADLSAPIVLAIPIETSNRFDPLGNEWPQEDNSRYTNPNSTPKFTDKRKKTVAWKMYNQYPWRLYGERHQVVWELQLLIPNLKVFAKTFPGATTQDMTDYVNPLMNHEPDTIFCHMGTNDLCSNQSPNDIPNV